MCSIFSNNLCLVTLSKYGRYTRNSSWRVLTIIKFILLEKKLNKLTMVVASTIKCIYTFLYKFLDTGQLLINSGLGGLEVIELSEN